MLDVYTPYNKTDGYNPNQRQIYTISITWSGNKIGLNTCNHIHNPKQFWTWNRQPIENMTSRKTVERNRLRKCKKNPFNYHKLKLKFIQNSVQLKIFVQSSNFKKLEEQSKQATELSVGAWARSIGTARPFLDCSYSSVLYCKRRENGRKSAKQQPLQES